MLKSYQTAREESERLPRRRRRSTYCLLVAATDTLEATQALVDSKQERSIDAIGATDFLAGLTLTYPFANKRTCAQTYNVAIATSAR